MKTFVVVSSWINKRLDAVAECILTFMMMLTVIDVVLRAFGKPIIGTYELVAVAGALVIGFSVSRTSEVRGHVAVDSMIENRSEKTKRAIFIITRFIGIILIGFLSYRLLIKAIGLYKTGEVSMTLRIPYYPPCFLLAFCFFIEFLTLVADLFRPQVNEGDAK